MTFSKRYGFLDQGVDIGGMLEAIYTFMKTVAPVSADENSRVIFGSMAWDMGDG